MGGGSLLLFISFLMTWMSFQGYIAVGVVDGIGLLILMAWLGVVGAVCGAVARTARHGVAP